MTPTEIWGQVDRISRLSCCYAVKGEACADYHPQGTRAVYGYEALSKGVQGAIHAARNRALDEAIGEVSKLESNDGSVQKAAVLEILSSLKFENLK